MRIIAVMVDDPRKPDKPDPVDDLKKGLGLLFRAAKTAMDKLPSDKLEEIVVTGVKEVGRAIENVTDQIDRQVFGGKGTVPHPRTASSEASSEASSGEAGKGPAKEDGAAASPANDVTKDGAGGGVDGSAERADKAKSDAVDPEEEPPRGPRVA